MSVLDRVVSAVTPEPSEKDRAEVRARARELAGGGEDWLALVLDHHEQIETAFEAVKTAGTVAARRAAQKQLGALLTAHSIAEEGVLYAGMALHDEKSESATAYTQQSAAKVQVFGLDELDPMSNDYEDKLEHLRAAVSHHVYSEEKSWFPELRKNQDATLQARLTKRYAEEFARYMNG